VFGDIGATDTKFDTSTYRVALDLNGALMGWDTSTSLGWVRGISDISYFGYPTLSGLNQVIANNNYYIGAQSFRNTQAVYNILDPTTASVATSQLQYIELNATRDLPWFALPGGPIGVAAGLSVHHWGQEDPGQPGSATGDTIGLGTTFIHGTETDQAVHAEISLPVIKMLELGGQVRFDKVIGTGSRISPKATFKLTPIRQIALRGTYSRGFRAPGPGEKGDSGVTFFETAPSDPIRCPVTHLPSDCGNAPGGAVFGAVTGNPQLQPERSEAYDLGIVLEPIKSVSVSADWYKIRRTDYIYNGPSSTFIRGPSEPPFPNLPGPIIGVAGPYVNLGSDVTSGLEFDARAKQEIQPIGTFSMQVTWTHLIYYDYCGLTFGGVFTPGCVDIVGSHGPEVISGNTGTPKDRGNAVFSLDRGPYELGFTVNYVSGYKHTDPTLGVFGDAATGCFVTWVSCHVGSFTDVDLFGHYDLSKQLQVSLHVLNLFDRDAPFDPEAQYGQNNYSVNWAQQGAVGRFYQVGLRYTF
jgi:iron complex outermembrane receptor protein